MRPFFSYYGSKYTGAKHYGKPRHDLVIEPFAGSACYSTYWNVENVKLYDVSPDICELWDFLINCSESDITSIPDFFKHDEEMLSLARGPRLLVGFWAAKGRAEPSGNLSPWYHQYKNSTDCRVWGPSVKERIVKQKPMIFMWKVDCLSYKNIPINEVAHWHVDPPYNNSAGSRYPHGKLDYADLSKWVFNLKGNVDVCENVGAAWLDFEPLYDVVSSRGRRSGSVSKEAVFRVRSDAGE
jgi:hypothetical protein